MRARLDQVQWLLCPAILFPLGSTPIDGLGTPSLGQSGAGIAGSALPQPFGQLRRQQSAE